MSQNREPPAYMEYAANMLANRKFRLMTAAERGVLHSMRLECWANRTLPRDPGELARILGLAAVEVAAALPAAMVFFSDETGEIRCPELDAYRADREAVRNAKSEGGKRGAEAANKKRQPTKTRATASSPAMPSGMPSGMPSAKVRHLNVDQTNQNQSPVKDSVADSWVKDYETAEQSESGKRTRMVV